MQEKLVSLRNVSASQFKTYDDCPRKWWFLKVAGKEDPSTLSQRRGTAIHYAMEHYYTKGEILDIVCVAPDTGQVEDHGFIEVPPEEDAGSSKYVEPELPPDLEVFNTRRYVEAAVNELSATPPIESQFIERKFRVGTIPDGPPCIGFQDLVLPDRILDYKTTNSIKRYALTPAELLRDPQALTYAYAALQEMPQLPEIIVTFLYLETRNLTKVNTKLVSAKFTRGNCDTFWIDAGRKVRDMIALSQEPDFWRVDTGAPEACEKYGGCPFKDACFNQGENVMRSSFMEELKKRRATATRAKRKPSASVLSPDSAPREVPVPRAQTTQIETPAHKDSPQAPLPAPIESPTPAEAPPESISGLVKENHTAPTTVLYIGCYPQKDSVLVPPKLLEDWIRPLLDTIDAETGGHHMLLEFGKQKAAISHVVREAIEAGGLPPRLVINTQGPLVQDVVREILPYASDVIRGFAF